MLAKFVAAIPKFTNGKLTLAPKNKEGQPLKSRIELLKDPRHDTPDLLPPPGTIDKSCIDTMAENGATREIKEWQAIMDHIRTLPVKNQGELPTILVDDRAKEVRAIKVG
jgi:5'-nucleotidase / UDP-sugar diphosphatase